MEFLPGTVTLVGGGPGDPDLLTVGGLKALRAADIVFYDRLAPLAALDECRAGAELVEVGKVPRGACTPQERINELLIEAAQAGKIVVRFKGGDSFVFGRGGEEWVACAAHGIPVQVIPGVTSSVAAPALAGIPVTHRTLTQGFTVVSGHVAPDDERCSVNWSAVALSNTTIVVLMGVKHLPEIVAALTAAGLDGATPAAVVMEAASSDMHVLRSPLAELPAVARAADVRPPAITVIGEVTQPGLLP